MGQGEIEGGIPETWYRPSDLEDEEGNPGSPLTRLKVM
jgi:hypothetical protein